MSRLPWHFRLTSFIFEKIFAKHPNLNNYNLTVNYLSKNDVSEKEQLAHTAPQTTTHVLSLETIVALWNIKVLWVYFPCNRTQYWKWIYSMISFNKISYNSIKELSKSSSFCFLTEGAWQWRIQWLLVLFGATASICVKVLTVLLTAVFALSMCALAQWKWQIVPLYSISTKIAWPYKLPESVLGTPLNSEITL